MTNRIQPIQPGHADKTEDISGAPGFQVERQLMGYAYPQHGNSHNPTPRYQWFLLLDGKVVDTDSRRSVLVAAARQPNAAKVYRDEDR